MNRSPRFPEGHRLMELDASDESCVAVCECDWRALTLGRLMRQNGAYRHAQHCWEIRLQGWFAADFRGPRPTEPEHADYVQRVKFKTYRKATVCR